jgi:hypothetical protein
MIDDQDLRLAFGRREFQSQLLAQRIPASGRRA